MNKAGYFIAVLISCEIMFNDPWSVDTDLTTASLKSSTQSIPAAFEDNFRPPLVTSPLTPHAKLPDSDQYLQSLGSPAFVLHNVFLIISSYKNVEQKLEKLKSAESVLNQLVSRREHCLESLLRGSITLPTDADFGLSHLDGDTENGRTDELIRRIIPERAINPVELVQLINYDQLQPQLESDDDTTTAGNNESKVHHPDNISR